MPKEAATSSQGVTPSPSEIVVLFLTQFRAGWLVVSPQWLRVCFFCFLIYFEIKATDFGSMLRRVPLLSRGLALFP